MWGWLGAKKCSVWKSKAVLAAYHDQLKARMHLSAFGDTG